MTNNLLPHLNIGPKQADFCVIWLHGLGANGHDFESIIPELRLADDYKIRFILPHAPTQAVTANGGMEMPAWYDIIDSARIDAKQDSKGIHLSADYINAFIKNQISQGILAKNIFLAGFSQGGVIALQAGLRYPQKLAGILALSTYLPLPETVAAEIHESNKNIPIMMTHGKFDASIPLAIGKYSCELLKKQGLDVQWFEYQMEHTVIPEEIDDIAAWFKNRISNIV